MYQRDQFDDSEDTLSNSRNRSLVRAIQGVLTPDLLQPGWRRRATNPLSGHCYVASEAAWYLLGGDKSSYRPKVARLHDLTHWWLEGPEGVLDVTAGQFSEPFPYELGRGCGFLTKGISRRSGVAVARSLVRFTSVKTELSGRRVRVYRNLHTGTWSVQDVKSGLVIAHPREVALADAQMVVRPGGRARVLATGRKNVHAFVIGTVVDRSEASSSFDIVRQVTYNPYRFESFCAHKVGDAREVEPIGRANYAWCDEFSRVLAAD